MSIKNSIELHINLITYLVVAYLSYWLIDVTKLTSLLYKLYFFDTFPDETNFKMLFIGLSTIGFLALLMILANYAKQLGLLVIFTIILTHSFLLSDMQRVGTPFLLVLLLFLIFSIQSLKNNNHELFFFIQKCALFISCISYFAGGFSKLNSPIWQVGQGISGLIGFPDKTLLYHWFKENTELLFYADFLTILIELAFLPLSLFSSTKRIGWWLVLAMHIGIVFMLYIPPISIPVIIYHLFLMDLKYYDFLIKFKVFIMKNRKLSRVG